MQLKLKKVQNRWKKSFFLIFFKNSFTSFFFRQNLFPSNLVAAIFFYWRLVGIGNGRKNAEGMVRIIGSSQRDGSWIFNIKNRLTSSRNTYYHTYCIIKEILDHICLGLYFNFNFSQTRLTIVFKVRCYTYGMLFDNKMAERWLKTHSSGPE